MHITPGKKLDGTLTIVFKIHLRGIELHIEILINRVNSGKVLIKIASDNLDYDKVGIFSRYSLQKICHREEGNE